MKKGNGDIGHIDFTEYGEIRVVVNDEWQRWTRSELEEVNNNENIEGRDKND